MQRVLEITAKSQEEARELAKHELKPGEQIASEEVLVAPTRGIFGIVGNPEFKIRFTFGAAPAAAATAASTSLFPEADDPFPAVETEAAPPPRSAAPPRRSDAPPPRRFDGPRSYDRPQREGSRPSGNSDRRPRNDRPARPDRPPRRIEEEPEIGSFGEDEPIEGPLPSITGSDTHASDAPMGPTGPEHPMYPTLQTIIKQVAATVGTNDLVVHERVENGHWIMDCHGTNIQMLIGKHGRTLDAVQYLVNIIANKGQEGRVRILLDAQGYREQRLKGLIQLANRMYRKVMDSGRQVELEPMSTVDRRTVHLALKDRTGIETFSRGTEPMRRVIIAPRRGAMNRGPRPATAPALQKGPEGAEGEAPQQPAARRAVPMFMQDDNADD